MAVLHAVCVAAHCCVVIGACRGNVRQPNLGPTPPIVMVVPYIERACPFTSCSSRLALSCGHVHAYINSAGASTRPQSAYRHTNARPEAPPQQDTASLNLHAALHDTSAFAQEEEADCLGEDARRGGPPAALVADASSCLAEGGSKACSCPVGTVPRTSWASRLPSLLPSPTLWSVRGPVGLLWRRRAVLGRRRRTALRGEVCFRTRPRAFRLPQGQGS